MYITTDHCKDVIKRSSRTFAASFTYDEKKYEDIKSCKISVPSASSGQISIGEVKSNSVEIILSKVDIPANVKIKLYEGVKQDDGTFVDIPMGEYTILKATTKDSLTTITAAGKLSTETQLGYFSELEYPATTIQMLDEISEAIGVTIITEGLEEIYVESKPEGYIYREIIGYIAGLHAANAYETRDGNIAFKWYESSDEDIFTDKTESPELSNDLFIINRFECTTGDATIIRGEGAVGISISNPLMTEAAADLIWSKVSGFMYRPGTFNVKSGTPCLDPWDSFTYNNETVICTSLEYVHDGGLQNIYKSSGSSETEAASSYKGPISTAMKRYYTELLIVKDIAAKSMTVDQADIRYAQIEQLDVIEANVSTAVIGTIDGRYATFDYVTSNYTTLGEFEALSGKVGTLETEVTKTNTLIFGSAGGTVIQSEFSNSVIAQVGEAQIKSAMIENLSLDKLLAGTIYTDDITIQSKSGNMILADNTLLISDGTFARVQIGKDASNDYSINVWDESGNLMWSQGGITENAIKEAIIRNDMVSENANISASKLDIDSLFTEINGSSNTIKATKIYLDDEKQTLDIAFSSMVTDVSALQTTQNSHGTQISVIQGQISNKIWQQDITTAVGDVEEQITTLDTKYASVNQTVDGLSTTVASNTTLINSMGTRVTSAESSITHHDDLISAKVSKDGVISAINQSAETVQIAANKINLLGAVTFSALDSSTQSLINTANTTANSANTKAQSIIDNIYTSGTTTINGGKITTGSISADKIDVSDLFAQNITMSGVFTATGSDWIYPTWADCELLKQAYLGNATLTSAQIKAFDITNSGAIESLDLLTVKKLLLGSSTIEDYITTYGYSPIESTVTAKINPSDVNKTIHIYGTNSFGTYVESYFGINQMKTTSALIEGATIGELDVTGELSVAGATTFNSTITAKGVTTVTTSNFGALVIERSGNTYYAGIGFKNSNGILGYIAMGGTKNSGLVRYNDTATTAYNILDTGNYSTCVVPKSGGTFTGAVTFSAQSYFNSGLELVSATPYIDFRYGSSTSDYNVRLINNESGVLECTGTFDVLGNIRLSNSKYVYGYNSSGTAINLLGIDNNNTLHVGVGVSTILKLGHASNTARLQLYSADRMDLLAGGVTSTNSAALSVTYGEVSGMATLRPTLDKKATLGTGSYRYMYIYNSSSTISTSDKNEKNTITNLDERFIKLWDLLLPKNYYLNAETEMGITRLKAGLIAQDVENAAYDVGLTLDDCGFIFKEWVKRDDYEGYAYGLDYNGISILTLAKVKNHEERIKELESQLMAANTMIINLQQQLWALS